jgi:HD-GYP domain-containing protein (c-di-GMP phosphodiesterase class II)
MMRDFGMAQLPYAQVLRNVVACHHEAWDGSGYPFGLRGENIPIEARITAAADVFDALTSSRPYKNAWTIDEALAHLQKNSGVKFYGPCIEALIANRERIEQIQSQFAEEALD